MVAAVVPDPKVVTTEQPRSAVTGAVFNRPLPTDALARGLEQFGAGMEDLATPLAKLQGQQDAANAVTRNPDGSIAIIDHPATPILGAAGDAYNRAVDTGILAGTRSQVDVDLAKIATQYANAPDQFQAAASEYIKQKQASLSGPIGVQTAQYAQAVATQHQTNLIAQKQRTDVSIAGNVMDGRLKQIEDQMDGLASQGGLNSSQFAALDKERSTILAQRVGNPAFAYSADQKAIDDANLQTRLSVATLTGAARDEAQRTGNVADALQKMDGELRKLPISEKERIAYEGEVTRHLSAMSAINGQQRQELSDQGDALKLQAHQHPDLVSDQQIDDASLALQRAKMFNKAAEVSEAKIYKNIIAPAVASGSVSDMISANRQIAAMAAGGGSEKTALDYFVSKGWTPYQAAGIVGNLVHESGGHLNTAAIARGDGSDGSDSIGIGQWNADRAKALRAFAAAQGKPVTDFQTQLDFVQHELETSEGNAASMLRKATDARSAAAAFALGYERPQGFMSGDISQVAGGQSRVANALRLAGGGATDMNNNSPIVMSYKLAVKESGEATNKLASKLWDNIDNAYSNKMQPTSQELSDIRQIVPFVGDAALRQKISEGLALHQTSDAYRTAPIADQQNVSSTLVSLGEGGQLGNLERRVAAPIAAQAARMTDMAQNDPVGLAAIKIGPRAAKEAGLQPVQPLDVNDPAGFVAGLKNRQTWKNIARQDPSVGNMPLQPNDIAAIKAQSPNWTGPQAASALGALGSTLTGPEQDALMSNKDFKDSVLGLAHSGDPQKMNAAYALLDAQYRRNPMTFQAQDGGKTLLELRSWQTLGQFLPPQEVAKRMAESSDPSYAKAKDALGEIAQKNLEGLDASSVIRSVYGWHAPLIGTYVPFTSPGDIASDRAGQAAGALLVDYKNAYTENFKETNDANAADKFATEFLKNKYSASAINGGRVMAYAPDREVADPSGAGMVGAYYPKVDGSFDWMKHQLFMDVANSRFGHDFRLDNRNQTLPTISLLADRNTEADIAAKRPPSYQILAVSPKDGRWHLIEETSGGRPMRFRPDPTDVQAGAAARFTAQRAADDASLTAEDAPPL